MMDWGGRGEHMTAGGWIFMALALLVLIVLVVVLVMWLVSARRRTTTATRRPGRTPRPPANLLP